VVSETNALSAIDAMRGVLTVGTGERAYFGRPAAGKTGTTSDYKDAWFIGYTGGFVTAVWVGKDDNTAMKRVTGGGAPAGIWHDYMTAALPRLKVQPIPGGDVVPPPPEGPDTIGSIIEGVQDLLHGDHEVQMPQGPDEEAPH